jgi:hypothetical protein
VPVARPLEPGGDRAQGGVDGARVRLVHVEHGAQPQCLRVGYARVVRRSPRLAAAWPSRGRSCTSPAVGQVARHELHAETAGQVELAQAEDTSWEHTSSSKKPTLSTMEYI